MCLVNYCLTLFFFFFIRFGIVMVSMLTWNVGSGLDWVRPKTIKLVFVASVLITQH